MLLYVKICYKSLQRQPTFWETMAVKLCKLISYLHKHLLPRLVFIIRVTKSKQFCGVTRCVCEKVAQNVAQSITCENKYTTLPRKKVAKLFALFQ
jgi:hypothetical protein